MRWTLGVIAFFLVIFAMNATLIYVAVSGQEPVEASYQLERR